MELITVYKLIKKYGNCACDLASVKSPKSEVHEFVEKYGITKGNIIKKENKTERDIIILWGDKFAMTDEVKLDVVRMMREHHRNVTLSMLNELM